MRETVNRRRREPSYRPIVLIENAAREQWFAVAARNLPGIIYQPVPTRKYPASELAAHVFGYVGEVTEAQLVSDEYRGDRAGRGRRPRRRREGVQPLPDGQGRHEGSDRQQPRAGDRRLARGAADRRAARAADHRRRRAEGHRGRLQALGELYSGEGYNGAAVVLDRRKRRGARRSSACRRTIPTSSPSASTGRRGRRCTTTSCGRCRTAPLQGTLLARLDLQAGGGDRRPRGRASSRPTTGCTAPAVQTFYGRYFQCHLKGGHGSVDMRHAIEKSCNVYFYTLGNMLGVDSIHKWASLLGLGEKNNIDLPNEVTRPGAVDRVEATQVMKEKWYAGETISVVDRPGPGERHAAVAGGDDDDAGQRRHPLHAARAQGRGRRQGSGSRCRRRRRSHRCDEVTSTVQAVHDGLWLAVNGARHGGPGAARGPRRLRQDRHGPGDLADQAPKAARKARSTSAITAGSCSSRRATIRRSPA